MVAGKGKFFTMDKFKGYLVNLIFPAFIFGSITGILTAIVVVAYKFLAKCIIAFSEDSYAFLRSNLFYIPLILIGLYLIALLFALIYKKEPRARGGGIPSSIALLRSIVTFKWLRTLIGVFFMSLTSFLIGVPLGNEGPSVLMGTALGKGSVSLMAKKHPAWSRYAMTGGACAGFAVATGASVSGIMFAVEEAHQRISPMIIIVGCIAVLFADLTSEILCPLLGVGASLFPNFSVISLSVGDVWIPLVVGLVLGLFAVAFLKYYKAINKFSNVILKKIPHYVKIFIVFTITLGVGLISFSFVSTGHEVFFLLLEKNFSFVALIVLLLVRTTLTLFANTNKLTGGVFLPIIAIGAIISSLIGKALVEIFGIDSEYYTVILALGTAACISGMMKMPLTAIMFSLEALGCVDNVVHVIVTVAVAYVITEVFGVKGINDSIVENMVKSQEETRERKIIDTHIVIKKGSFAEYRHARDILWPTNFFLLSIIPSKTRHVQVDGQGAKTFHEGDVLHIRYATFDEEHTRAELIAIVGEQDYDQTSTMSE